MKKVYVASSWRNKWYNAFIFHLRLSWPQLDVYDFRNPPNKSGFGWEQINSNWKQWTFDEYVHSLTHDLAVTGYESDYNSLVECDFGIVVMPCGRSAHLEAGIMLGMGKPVYALILEEQEPELMYKAFSGIFNDYAYLFDELKREHLI